MLNAQQQEVCPICFGSFPIAVLPEHVEECLAGVGSSGGSRSSSRQASPARTHFDVLPPSLPQRVHSFIFCSDGLCSLSENGTGTSNFIYLLI